MFTTDSGPLQNSGASDRRISVGWNCDQNTKEYDGQIPESSRPSRFEFIFDMEDFCRDVRVYQTLMIGYYSEPRVPGTPETLPAIWHPKTLATVLKTSILECFLRISPADGGYHATDETEIPGTRGFEVLDTSFLWSDTRPRGKVPNRRINKFWTALDDFRIWILRPPVRPPRPVQNQIEP